MGGGYFFFFFFFFLKKTFLFVPDKGSILKGKNITPLRANSFVIE